ncbi:MAG: malonic semialdehyde reductase [Hyphomonadaceae bacterium]
MAEPLPDTALDQIFRAARSRNAWHEKAVPEALVRAVYDLAKMGPTSANQSPARFIWLGSTAAKERLKPFLMEGNVAKVMTAPWCVIIAHDLNFREKLPRLFPHNPGAKEWFADPAAAAAHAFRNGSLQGAYLMLAARALGLDCGAMSGFDNAGVDKEFFSGDPEMAQWRSNFICAIGYGSDENLFARSPRLPFEEACRIL